MNKITDDERFRQKLIELMFEVFILGLIVGVLGGVVFDRIWIMP